MRGRHRSRESGSIALVAWAVLLAASGCGGGGSGPGDPDGVPSDTAQDVPSDVPSDLDRDVPPDEPAPDETTADSPPPDAGLCPPAAPGPGQVRARIIECPGELLHGPHAVGRVGDIVLENALVRFVVRTGPEGHALLGLFGGGLVDALGPGSQDMLRELQPLVSFNVVQTDRVEIADAGEGGEAVVEASGVPVPHPVLESVVPGIPLDATVIQEYALHPDEPWLRLRTRVRPVGGGEVEVIPADLLMLGGAARPFLPGTVPGDSAAVSGPFLAAAGNGASYAYVRREGVQGLEVGGSEILLADPITATDAEEAVFERFLVVGDGSISSVAGPAYGLRGDAAADIAGTVLRGTEPPGAGWHVEALDGAGLPLSRFDADPDGRFGGRLPRGPATLKATCDGCPDGPDLAVDVPAEGLSGLEVQARAQSWLEVTVREAGAGIVPARVSVGPADRPDERPRFLFTGAGAGRFPLAPGTWRVTVSRGMEYERVVRDAVVVTEGETVTLEADLARSVDTTGAIAAEFHLHSESSVDSSVPIPDRVAACAAEGMEFVVATDHDFVTDYGPALDLQGLGPFLTAVVGCEVSSVAAGHFMSWPIPVDPGRAGNGAPHWFGLSPPALVDRLRADHPGSIVQVNHPRFDDGSTFDIVKYDPADGHAHADPVALGFPADTDLDRMDYDSIEVYNAIGHKDVDRQLEDWYSLLNLGRRITATAGGDSHSLDAFPGNPRNLVFLGTDDPAQATAESVMAALRSMRILVTSGPFVRAGVVPPGGGTTSLPGDLVTDTDGEVALQVEVQAPSWMDVDEIVVVANGRAGSPIPVPQAVPPDVPPVVRYAATLPQPALADTWFVVIVRGDARDPVLINRAPFAVTNPFFVDADGDGTFTPPGL